MAFKAGLEEHKVDVRVTDCDDYDNEDLVVQWGIRNQKLISKSKNYLILERGYVGDREEYTSTGFNGLNGRGYSPRPPEELTDRVVNLACKNMYAIGQGRGKYILVLGQVPSDMSVKPVNYNKWLQDKVMWLRKEYPEILIRYRPHPLDKEPFIPDLVNEVSEGRTVGEDIINAVFTVSLSSNAGVDSLLMGKLVMTDSDVSMVKRFDRRLYSGGERMEWFNNICYRQWTIEEMASGQAWEHLKKGMV